MSRHSEQQPKQQPDGLISELFTLPPERRYGLENLLLDEENFSSDSGRHFRDSYDLLQQLLQDDHGFLNTLRQQQPVTLSSNSQVRLDHQNEVSLLIQAVDRPQCMAVYKLIKNEADDLCLDPLSYSHFLALFSQTGQAVVMEQFYKKFRHQGAHPFAPAWDSFDLAWEALYLKPDWFQPDSSTRQRQNLVMLSRSNSEAPQKLIHRQVGSWQEDYNYVFDWVEEKPANNRREYQEITAANGVDGQPTSHIIHSRHFDNGDVFTSDYRPRPGVGVEMQHLVWRENYCRGTQAGDWLGAIENMDTHNSRRLKYRISYCRHAGPQGSHVSDLNIVNGRGQTLRSNFIAGPHHIDGLMYPNAIQVPDVLTDFMLDRYYSLVEVKSFVEQIIPQV